MDNNEFCLLEQYKLTPNELYAIKVILLAQIDGDFEWIKRYIHIINFEEILQNLQNKEIILKSFKLPKKGDSLNVQEIPLNKNFIKQYFKASFILGKELFDTYPATLNISGVLYNARRISKKFDSLEDAYFKYAKSIKNNPETHNKIINLVKWGIENNYNFTTLDDFIVDNAWNVIEAIKNGDGVNINLDAIQMI